MGRVDNRQVSPAEISDDSPSISVLISNLIHMDKNGSRNIKDAFGVRNTDSLIKYTCFYIKINRVHVFCSVFSQVCMFCDDDCSKLFTESTHSRVTSVVKY